MNLDVQKKPTVPDVLPLVKAYCAKHKTGWNLHAVLDDNNIEDGHIEYCRNEAVKDHDDEGVAIADLLLKMSKTQRNKITSLCWIGVP